MSARPQADRGYKRSWKNLLINKSYQLRFTAIMVGLSTVLMAGLGIWVMRVADTTTAVAMASVRGTPCPKNPTIQDVDDTASPTERAPDAPATGSAAGSAQPPADPGNGSKTAPGSEPGGEPTAAGSAAGSAANVDTLRGDSAAEPDPEMPRRVNVVVDESSMQIVPVPDDYGPKVVAHWTCKMRLSGQISELERGRRRILWVLIMTGILLVLGLAVYGIKMTHKVAGPLFKVSLYLAKMRDGRLDKVWNLRKGDQLVEFYEHFKTAHAGVVQMEKDDIAAAQAVITAAEAAGAGQHSSVQRLRDLVARKEKSLE